MVHHRLTVSKVCSGPKCLCRLVDDRGVALVQASRLTSLNCLSLVTSAPAGDSREIKSGAKQRLPATLHLWAPHPWLGFQGCVWELKETAQSVQGTEQTLDKCSCHLRQNQKFQNKTVAAQLIYFHNTRHSQDSCPTVCWGVNSSK